MKKIFIITIIFILGMGLASAGQIKLSDLTIEEKIGQMIMVKGNKFDQKFIDLKIGGIFLNGPKSTREYRKIIEKYQNKTKIKLFAATDMEGYWNPFLDYKSKSLGDIKNSKESKLLGAEHAKKLKESGFNINFAPVVEKNDFWNGRTFTGDFDQRNKKINNYIKGLQSGGIIATAKHYPGGNLTEDPHEKIVKSKISNSDLKYFRTAIK